MVFNYLIIFTCVLRVYSSKLPENNTTIISTYAKVAHWGAVSTTEKPLSEARSHNGQTLWTHRSDVNIVSGQNLKTVKPKVVYHYAQKLSQEQKEASPGVGEVQERFNPRPYFDYTHVPSKYSKTETRTKPKSDAGQSPNYDNFPVFSQAPSASPGDLYTSPYNSYNPPNSGPVNPVDDSKPDIAYPPNAPPPPGDPDITSVDSGNGYSYDPPQDAAPAPEGPPAYPTLGPPLAPHKDQIFYPPSDDQDHNGHDYYPSINNHDHKTQIYYPPSGDDGHHETILDHPPPGWQDSDADMAKPPDMNGNGNGMKDNGNGMKPNGINGNGHDMAEQDLSPPPASDYSGQFPHYLYNGHEQGHNFDYDYDHHHVYKEITTTEAPEDERVNKGHYSYYYLGRKLWYIPLYFSLYFILYVTVLILKSIARHKIQFKQEHYHRDQGKDMSKDMGHGRSLNLDELHQNVSKAIDTSRRKFAYVAM